MPHRVEAMKRKRQRHHHLCKNLQRHRPLGKRRRHSRGRHGQPKQGGRPSRDAGEEVEDAKTIQADGEDESGDAVKAGVYPGYLGAVDGEVGGDGTVEALVDEDLGGSGGAGCGSVVWDAGGCAGAESVVSYEFGKSAAEMSCRLFSGKQRARWSDG